MLSLFGGIAGVAVGGQGITFGGVVTGGGIQKSGAGVLTLGASTTIGVFATGYQIQTGSTKVPSGGTLTFNGGTGGYAIIGGSFVDSSGQYSGTLDTTEATKFTSDVGNFYVGYTFGGQPNLASSGTLNLGADSEITAAGRVWIGHSGNQPMTTGGVVTTAVNGVATIKTPLMTIGTGKSAGSLTLGSGSTLNVSGIEPGARTALETGNTTIGTGTSFVTSLNAGGGTFNGVLSGWVIGNGSNSGAGNTTATSTNGCSGISPGANLLHTAVRR